MRCSLVEFGQRLGSCAIVTSSLPERIAIPTHLAILGHPAMQTNHRQTCLNGILCRGKRIFEEEQVIVEETWNTFTLQWCSGPSHRDSLCRTRSLLVAAASLSGWERTPGHFTEQCEAELHISISAAFEVLRIACSITDAESLILYPSLLVDV